MFFDVFLCSDVPFCRRKIRADKDALKGNYICPILVRPYVGLLMKQGSRPGGPKIWYPWAYAQGHVHRGICLEPLRSRTQEITIFHGFRIEFEGHTPNLLIFHLFYNDLETSNLLHQMAQSPDITPMQVWAAGGAKRACLLTFNCGFRNGLHDDFVMIARPYAHAGLA